MDYGGIFKMGIIITFIVAVTLIGAVFAYYVGNRKKEDAAVGAAVGLYFAFSSIVTLMLFGFAALVGAWLIGSIFS
ncbi:hypothetical protein MNBD_BACTEROID07-1072 [hydrothermal vent metagenome]|uniref:Uncharacterized protein n=1 Tax=hydrothermal vent metagenome TaxID=652676 RepID=A0A3B0UEP4_9ZZZZ